MSKKKSILKKNTQYPSKTTINLVQNTEGEYIKRTIIFFCVFLVFFALFVKIAVLEPIKRINLAANKYHAEEEELRKLKEYNNDYAEVKKKFDKVSGWYLDDLEKKEADKYEALKMIREDIMPYADVKNVSIQGEMILVTTEKMKFQDVSKMLLKLQEDKRNEFVTVETASAVEKDNELVFASITIKYINNSEEDIDA